MCGELKQKINSINLVLDEKKCTTMKHALEHIQSKIKDVLGIPNYQDDNNKGQIFVAGTEAEESGDEVMIEIPKDSSSEDEGPINQQE